MLLYIKVVGFMLSLGIGQNLYFLARGEVPDYNAGIIMGRVIVGICLLVWGTALIFSNTP